ncbi:hypothetical protein [Bacillus sp. KH172YL63]|uniref:hypothetical protein n=1 Tax=Bacillus sp. KH172YL63 TaxID=2709784 RepID=UPI0015658B5F|nr:hypothetical protein [Bacillus sp. KH172YL63]
MDIHGYRVGEEVLRSWGERLVPEVEWFYFDEEIEGIGAMEETASLDYLRDVPLDIRTSYCTWAISERARFFTKMEPESFAVLQQELKDQILKKQWELGRGLVFKKDELYEWLGTERLDTPVTILDSGEEVILLHRLLWESLPKRAQHSFLLNYCAMWIKDRSRKATMSEEDVNEIFLATPHLRDMIDAFPLENGPNCLAAVATALSGNRTYKDQWMMSVEFMGILHNEGYHSTDSKHPRRGDVLVWYTQDRTAVHAAYVLTPDYVFNKHGQTMFNPWQLLSVEEVLSAWNQPDLVCVIYRKKSRGT